MVHISTGLVPVAQRAMCVHQVRVPHTPLCQRVPADSAAVPLPHSVLLLQPPGIAPTRAHTPARRKLAELEAQLVEEETAARISEAVEAWVAEALASEAVQQSLQQRLEEERRHIEAAVRCTVLRGGG